MLKSLVCLNHGTGQGVIILSYWYCIGAKFGTQIKRWIYRGVNDLWSWLFRGIFLYRCISFLSFVCVGGGVLFFFLWSSFFLVMEGIVISITYASGSLYTECELSGLHSDLVWQEDISVGCVTLGTTVRILSLPKHLAALQSISPLSLIYSVIKGQFLSYHAYMVQEVKNRYKRRLRISAAHPISHTTSRI